MLSIFVMLLKRMEFDIRPREKIEKVILPEQTDITVTISGGVCKYKNHDKPSTFISEADKLLYKAKENGRNRIEY